MVPCSLGFKPLIWGCCVLSFTSLILRYDVSALDRRDTSYYKSPVFGNACLEIFKENQCEYVRTIWKDVAFIVTSKFQDQELECEQKLQMQRIQFERLLEFAKLDFVKQTEKMILQQNKEHFRNKKENYILVDQLLNLKAKVGSLEEEIKRKMILKTGSHIRPQRLDNLIETKNNDIEMLDSYYHNPQITLQEDYNNGVNSIDMGMVRIELIAITIHEIINRSLNSRK